MTEEEVKKHGFNLYALYVELVLVNKDYAHDPEAHNLCSAVCQFTDGTNYELLAYSNPSSLATNVKKYVLGSLIPANKIHRAIIDRGGMQDLHTEVRLLNYLADQGYLGKTGTISFFSTRSVCKTCAEAIAKAQKICAANIAFIPYELKAETWVAPNASSSSASSASASSSSASSANPSVYQFLAQKGTGGATRSSEQQAKLKLDA